jgi:hypothetical protein
MDDDGVPKPMTVPKWDSKAKMFQLWWVRSMVHVTVCKFTKALSTMMESDMPASEDEDVAEDDDGEEPQRNCRCTVYHDVYHRNGYVLYL